MENKNLEKKYSRNNVFDKDGKLLPIEHRTFITNEGYECILVDGGTKSSYVTCKIEEYLTEYRTEHVKSGKVKYPYHNNVHGVGFIGVGSRSKGSDTKVYELWCNMLFRAYNSDFHEKHPTYKDVTVHDDWHNFQNFAAWCKNKNYTSELQLDKDLLSGPSKTYSPETCVFIPTRLNTFLSGKHKSTNTSGKVGVSWHKQCSKWRVNISLVVEGRVASLGLYEDKEEAAKIYNKARAEQAQVWKDRMQGSLPQHVIDRIA